MRKNWMWIGLAVLSTLPGLVMNFTVFKQLVGTKGAPGSAPWVMSIVLCIAIVGAAFMLSWAVEVAQLDIPQALALSVLALIAVLPEYSVDFALTYRAGTDPTYEQFAVANMIGANRMIVGFAWPLVIFIFCLKFRKKHVFLGHGQRVEIGFLLLAGLYSLTIPIKGHIDIFDCVVLVGLFVVYTFRISKASVHEPELIGPAEMLGKFPKAQRLTIIIFMLLYAGTVIFLLAEHFAESLIETGAVIGVDEVFMVQWFAPLASEAPEIVVVVLFTLRGLASEGLGALVASKVNQWTLLVGTLPLVFSLGSSRLRALPLNQELVGSMLVTSAQTLLAVMIILNLRAGLWGASGLFGLLVLQFFFPNSETTHNANFIFFRADSHYVFSAIYFVVAIGLAIYDRHHFIPTAKAMFSPSYVRKEVEEFGEVEETHAPAVVPR